MFTTNEDAIREAMRIVTAQRCAIGQHVMGCQHRPASPWVERAKANMLPASDRTGFIRNAK